MTTVEAVLAAVASPTDDKRGYLWQACLEALFQARCTTGRDFVVGSDY